MSEGRSRFSGQSSQEHQINIPRVLFRPPSHAVVEAYVSDPLVHDQLATGTAREWAAGIDALVTGAPSYKLPLLITAQPSDKIVPFKPIQEFYDKVGSSNKKLVALEPEYEHEAHNDKGKDKVIQIWQDFILERAAAGPYQGGRPRASL